MEEGKGEKKERKSHKKGDDEDYESKGRKKVIMERHEGLAFIVSGESKVEVMQ